MSGMTAAPLIWSNEVAQQQHVTHAGKAERKSGMRSLVWYFFFWESLTFFVIDFQEGCMLFSGEGETFHCGTCLFFLVKCCNWEHVYIRTGLG